MNTQKLEKLSLKLKRKFEKSREKVKNIQERYTSQKIKLFSMISLLEHDVSLRNVIEDVHFC